MIAYFVGLFTGASAGILVVCLCIAGRDDK